MSNQMMRRGLRTGAAGTGAVRPSAGAEAALRALEDVPVPDPARNELLASDLFMEITPVEEDRHEFKYFTTVGAGDASIHPTPKQRV